MKSRYELECEEYDKRADDAAPGRVVTLVTGPLKMLEKSKPAPKRKTQETEDKQ